MQSKTELDLCQNADAAQNKQPASRHPDNRLLRCLLDGSTAGLNVFANPSDGIAGNGRQGENENQRRKYYFLHTSILDLSRLKGPANLTASSTHWPNTA